jgi:hypothetical protein
MQIAQDNLAHVRFWHKADIRHGPGYVRLVPRTDIEAVMLR